MCGCDKKKSNWMVWVPLIALIVALIAFSFQVGVLYPWHEQLSGEFSKLARQLKR